LKREFCYLKREFCYLKSGFCHLRSEFCKNFELIDRTFSSYTERIVTQKMLGQLRFQVQKLGANFATKFASSFQCLNFVCKQMFILNNNSQFTEMQTLLIDHWTKNVPLNC
jgi:hypothetical protein